jgi:hypothetical protein
MTLLKNLATNYGGAARFTERSPLMRTPYGNIAAPPNGYLWDTVLRAKRAVRSYGEFAEYDRTGTAEPEPANAGRSPLHGAMKATVPGLEGHVHPSFPTFNMSVPDNQRIDITLEFKAFGANASWRRPYPPKRRPRARAPAADARDDRGKRSGPGPAGGAISHSVYWKDSAIFILEDDAQDGPDHVDAHRSPAFVVSSYTRRGIVDSTLYTTSGMLRTMELILGAEPMTQYDAAATPMHAAFQNTATLTPYTKKDAGSLTERNRWGAKRRRSARMDFDDADAPMMG